jgi:hypothetical protein
MFVKRRFGEVPADSGQVFEAEFVGTIGAVPHTLLLHAIPPNSGRFIPNPAWAFWVHDAASTT